MGQLTAYLQQQFHQNCPPDWQAQREVRLLSDELRRLLGYSPQVDVALTHESGRRLGVTGLETAGQRRPGLLFAEES